MYPSVTPPLSETPFLRNSSDGEKIGAVSRVKLAYKRISAPIFTSDGHPMLLDPSFSVKKMSRLNCYVFACKIRGCAATAILALLLLYTISQSFQRVFLFFIFFMFFSLCRHTFVTILAYHNNMFTER